MRFTIFLRSHAAATPPRAGGVPRAFSFRYSLKIFKELSAAFSARRRTPPSRRSAPLCAAFYEAHAAMPLSWDEPFHIICVSPHGKIYYSTPLFTLYIIMSDSDTQLPSFMKRKRHFQRYGDTGERAESFFDTREEARAERYVISSSTPLQLSFHMIYDICAIYGEPPPKSASPLRFAFSRYLRRYDTPAWYERDIWDIFRSRFTPLYVFARYALYAISPSLQSAMLFHAMPIYYIHTRYIKRYIQDIHTLLLLRPMLCFLLFAILLATERG